MKKNTFVQYRVMQILFLALFVLQSGMAFSAVPTIEVYTKPSAVEPGSFRLSPTGEFISLIVPGDDRSSLIVLNRASKQITANITPGTGQYIDDYHWVNDRRIVLSMAEKDGGVSTPSPTGELWGIDADGKNSLYLFGYRGRSGVGYIKRGVKTYASAFVLESVADANDTILVAIRTWGGTGETAYADLARMNVRSGSLYKNSGRIPLRYFSKVLVDLDKKVRLVSGVTTDRYSQLLYRDPKTSEWININDEKKTGRAIQPLAYRENGRDIYAIVSESGKLDYLIQFNPETKAEKTIYAPAQADIGGLLRTADQKDAYALQTFEGRGGYVFLNKDLPESVMVKNVMGSFPGELVIANSFSRDGRFASVIVTSDVNPGDYYIFDRDSNKLSLFMRARPDIDPDTSASVEPIEFKARDGLLIRGWLTRPNNSPANAKLPLVVMPHGGPYGEVDRWEFNSEAQLLASRGYAVMQVNFRGSGGYGVDFTNAGMREWGGKMQQDITDATRWIIGQNNIDANKICIYGISYGAYASLMGVATEPGLFKCAIGYAGVYELGAMSRQGDTDDTAYGRQFLEDIFVNEPTWLRARSPTRLAAQIKVPVMLIHGGQDQRAPISQGKEMQKALIAAGNPPVWVYEATEGHGFFNPKKRLNAYQSIIDFLDKNIGAASKQ